MEDAVLGQPPGYAADDAGASVAPVRFMSAQVAGDDVPHPVRGYQRYRLHVEVLALYGAQKMDLWGDNDIYVVLRLNGGQEWRTPVVTSMEPHWTDARYSWWLSNIKLSQIQISVWDEDILFDDAIGTVTIDVKDLTIGAVREVTLPVIPAKKVKMAGRLSLRMLLEAEMPPAQPG